MQRLVPGTLCCRPRASRRPTRECRRCGTCRWTCGRARSMPSSARTAPANRPSSGSSRAPSSRTPGPFAFDGGARRAPRPARRARSGHRRRLPAAHAVPASHGRREPGARPRARLALAAHRLGRAPPRGARRCSRAPGPQIDPDRPASELSMAEQQLVEIARALGSRRPHRHHGRADRRTPRARRRTADRGGAGTSAAAAQACCTSPTASTRSSSSRTASRCCATAAAIDTRAASAMDRSTLISLMVGREMSAVYRHEPHVQPREVLG